MSERNHLLESIASTIRDYRFREIDEPKPEHVEKWGKQFDKTVQIPLLREVDHVLKKTYLRKKAVTTFFSNLVENKKLAGEDPCAFWTRANFMKIQKKGHSQEEILGLFDECLQKLCGRSVSKCGKAGGDYIYLDDVMFSGNRVGSDLTDWINMAAPGEATVHVIVIASHTIGEYLAKKRLDKVIQKSGKKIKPVYWRAITIENRKYYKDDSGVLWPSAVPDDPDIKEYIAQPHRYPFEPRNVGGKLGWFSSEGGRQLLERELLIAGVKIRKLCQNPSDILRPLGFSPFGLGFGSMIFTYRNCPNNCPLAFWWGDPEATSGPFYWYPLLPRKTDAQSFGFDVVEI